MSKHPPVQISSSQIRDISPSLIFVPATRLRKMRPEKVKEIAASLKRHGQIQPVVTRLVDDKHTLVVGVHRLAAAKQLGWSSIKCVVREDLDDIGAELLEIDENLVRAELTQAEEAKCLARRGVLWNQQEQQVGKVCPPVARHGHHQKKGFAADTAEKTGKSKRSINQKVARAEKIAPDVLEQVIGTEWDRGVHLDHFAQLTHDEQRQAVRSEPKPAAPSAGHDEPVEMSEAEATAEDARVMPVLIEEFADECTRHLPELAAGHVTLDELVDVREQVRTIRKWLDDLERALQQQTPAPETPMVPAPDATIEIMAPLASNDPGPIPDCLVRRQA